MRFVNESAKLSSNHFGQTASVVAWCCCSKERYQCSAQIRVFTDQGQSVVSRGRYAAFTQLEALDMSVLGRDIIGVFALIVEQQGQVACLLGQNHYYKIVTQ